MAKPRKGEKWKTPDIVFSTPKPGSRKTTQSHTKIKSKRVTSNEKCSHPEQICIRDGETTIKVKFTFPRGGIGAERKIVTKRCFSFGGKRHDNKCFEVQILVFVIAHAPICRMRALLISFCTYAPSSLNNKHNRLSLSA